jgi:hypothetical protein
MINIFFVPGMFGSTVEFVLRSYTNEYVPLDSIVDSDGSLHTFCKEFHPLAKEHILQNLDKLPGHAITTPIYPFEKSHLPEILSVYTTIDNSSNLLIHANNTREAELNLLFQYYKIAYGCQVHKGLSIFAGNDSHGLVTNWNPAYTHWSDMKPWEFREWFSLFYVPWIQEWVNSKDQVPSNFLKIQNTEILFNTKDTFLKIINFCNLSLDETKDLDMFVNEWQSKQEYIVNEFDLLDQILDSTVNNHDFEWAPLNSISESIIQQRLRSRGYEIRCDGLDIFPTNSKSLYNLLYNC